jgi:hypothetical protein
MPVTSREEIIPLWQEAFGDTKEEIVFFLDNCKHKMILGNFEKDKLISILFLVECSLGKYIYAACTKKEKRGTGSMSELLRYCKNHYEKLCLIPANEGLVSYYEHRGFKEKCDLSCLKFHEMESIQEYLLEGCELKQPFILLYP